MIKICQAGTTSKAVGAFIFAQDTGRILVARRGLSGDAPDVWGTIGGSIEEGETPLEALARELFEEVGFRGNLETCYLLKLFTSPDKSFTYYTYIAFVRKQFRCSLNLENNNYVWLKDWEDLQGLSPWHEGVQDILSDKKYMEELKRVSLDTCNRVQPNLADGTTQRVLSNVVARLKVTNEKSVPRAR